MEQYIYTTIRHHLEPRNIQKPTIFTMYQIYQPMVWGDMSSTHQSIISDSRISMPHLNAIILPLPLVPICRHQSRHPASFHVLHMSARGLHALQQILHLPYLFISPHHALANWPSISIHHLTSGFKLRSLLVFWQTLALVVGCFDKGCRCGFQLIK